MVHLSDPVFVYRLDRPNHLRTNQKNHQNDVLRVPENPMVPGIKACSLEARVLDSHLFLTLQTHRPKKALRPNSHRRQDATRNPTQANGTC